MTASEAGWPRLLRRQFEFVDLRIGLVRLQNLETLLRDVLPSRSYPIEWVIYRMTGIDSASEGAPTSVEGEALLPELVALIEDMSRTLGPLPFDPSRDLSVDESARRLGVSSRTLRRWRPRGLPVLRFEGGAGGPRVGIRRDQLAWFTEIHRPQVERARRHRVVDPAEAETIRRRFSEGRANGLGESEAIRAVARASKRSDSTVRRLAGLDRRKDAVLTGRTAQDRRRRLIVRGFDRAVPIEEMAIRVDRNPRTVHRIVLEGRRDRLRGLPESILVPAGVERTDAGRVFGVAGQLDLRCRNEARGTLEAWLADVRTERGTDSESARQWMAAMHFALWRARRHAEEMLVADRSPTVDRVDAVESDLRWWALLRERSVRSGLASGLQRLEQSLGREIEALPIPRIRELLDRLIVTTAAVVDGFDPERRVLDHTLERACALAASRMMATVDPVVIASTARARVDLGAVPAPDLLGPTPASVRVLLGVERWWRRVGGLLEGTRGFEVAKVRYGLEDRGRPRSWRETAAVIGRPASHLRADALAFERALRLHAIAGSS